MHFVFTDKAPKPIGPYSQAVKHNDTLYISGQIGINPSTGHLIREDIQAETRQVLMNIHAILKEESLQKEHIIKCSIFISDMEQFSQINEIYSQFFGDHSPARETVQVSKLPAGANIEISAIAAVI
mgnify:CR=1 FL=1